MHEHDHGWAQARKAQQPAPRAELGAFRWARSPSARRSGRRSDASGPSAGSARPDPPSVKWSSCSLPNRPRRPSKVVSAGGSSDFGQLDRVAVDVLEATEVVGRLEELRRRARRAPRTPAARPTSSWPRTRSRSPRKANHAAARGASVGRPQPARKEAAAQRHSPLRAGGGGGLEVAVERHEERAAARPWACRATGPSASAAGRRASAFGCSQVDRAHVADASETRSCIARLSRSAASTCRPLDDVVERGAVRQAEPVTQVQPLGRTSSSSRRCAGAIRPAGRRTAESHSTRCPSPAHRRP